MIGSGEGFGPAGPGAGEAPPFAVAGPSQVAMDTSRSGTGSFTVSNVTGRAVRARVMVVPGAGADASWFEVQGEPERALPVAGTTTVDVLLQVPDDAPAGAYSLVLGAALEESPDQVVSGPTVTFQVPEPNKRKFPWWIVIVAAVGVLLLAGGGILIRNLTRSNPQPTPTATLTAEVVRTGAFLASPEIVVDLDTDQRWPIDDPARPKRSPDIVLRQGAGSGELTLRGYDDTRLAVVDEPTYAACEGATDYDDDEAQSVLILPSQRELLVCVKSTDQGRRALLVFGPRIVGRGQIVESTLWE